MIWAALAAWDTIQAQLFSKSWQANTPPVLNLISDRPWYVWVIAGLAILLFMALEGAYRQSQFSEESHGEALAVSEEEKGRLQSDLNAYQTRPKPRIVFGQPSVDTRSLVRVRREDATFIHIAAANFVSQIISIPPVPSSGTSVPERAEEVIARPQFAHVTVCNDPEDRSLEATAKDVIARISFSSLDGRHLFTIDGRWGSTVEQPADRSPRAPIEDMRRINLPPNGESHELDIALKHEEDEVCYGFSSESFRSADGRKPEWCLDGEAFQVEVRLQGVGMKQDQTEWFLLRNLGRGGAMRLTLLRASA